MVNVNIHELVKTFLKQHPGSRSFTKMSDTFKDMKNLQIVSGKTRRLWHILTHELMQCLEDSRVNYYTEG